MVGVVNFVTISNENISWAQLPTLELEGQNGWVELKKGIKACENYSA